MNILKQRMTLKSAEIIFLCLAYSVDCLESKGSSTEFWGTAVVWESGEINSHPLRSLFLTGQIFQNLLLRTLWACSFLGDIFIFNNNQLRESRTEKLGCFENNKEIEASLLTVWHSEIFKKHQLYCKIWARS